MLNSFQHSSQIIIDSKGTFREMLIRLPFDGQFVVVDAINCVFSVNTFSIQPMKDLNTSMKQLQSMDLDLEQSDFLDQIILDGLSSELVKIFGENFGNITPKNLGYLRYKRGFIVYSDEMDILLNIGLGGQNGTMIISLTGTGCKLADDGWEFRLKHFLENVAVDAKISRIDLAHDDLEGQYSSFDWANQMETNNAFVLPKTRNRPACTIAGEYKHGDPNNKGLTLYVGSRRNGKLIRCYEKGKELGNPNSLWFRSELEIRSDDKRYIPFDVLTNPTDYFCGAYPYCLELVERAKKHRGDTTPQITNKFQIIKRASEIGLNRALEIIRNQFGKYIKVFGEIFTQKTPLGHDKKDSNGNILPDFEMIFNKICTNQVKDYHPKRLKLTANYFKNTPFVDVDDILFKRDFDTGNQKISDDDALEYFYQTTLQSFQNPTLSP